ncbi:MAG: hypothetical protein RLY61_284 [Candidatus Parcubacteria bacterium]|jgi:hypothetical protein
MDPRNKHDASFTPEAITELAIELGAVPMDSGLHSVGGTDGVVRCITLGQIAEGEGFYPDHIYENKTNNED